MQKGIKFIFLLVAAGSILACGGGTDSKDPEWNLIWSDEFEGPSGQSPDTSKWVFDIGTDWGNRQLEYDTGRPENVSLDGDGNLAIVAIEESYAGQSYTSARIKTQDKFESAFGRFEARMKMPYGQGLWPAFWLLGANFEEAGWPQCGEIDIMEYRGQEPTIIHGTIHGPGYSGSQGIGSSYVLSNARFDTAFYTFAVEWDLNRIQWFVDDEPYQTITAQDVPGEWVYNHPFFIILNLAVGGGYVGSPDANTQFPQTLLVDYVRVYEQAN